MPWFRSIWIKFRGFALNRSVFDACQCDERCISYNQHHIQKAEDNTPVPDREASEQDVVVLHERAGEAEVGEKIRDRYREVAEEELPRNILNVLADLNQRLNRRDRE